MLIIKKRNFSTKSGVRREIQTHMLKRRRRRYLKKLNTMANYNVYIDTDDILLMFSMKSDRLHLLGSFLYIVSWLLFVDYSLEEPHQWLINQLRGHLQLSIKEPLKKQLERWVKCLDRHESSWGLPVERSILYLESPSRVVVDVGWGYSCCDPAILLDSKRILIMMTSVLQVLSPQVRMKNLWWIDVSDERTKVKSDHDLKDEYAGSRESISSTLEIPSLKYSESRSYCCSL